jgi:hypothetical protein
MGCPKGPYKQPSLPHTTQASAMHLQVFGKGVGNQVTVCLDNSEHC